MYVIKSQIFRGHVKVDLICNLKVFVLAFEPFLKSLDTVLAKANVSSMFLSLNPVTEPARVFNSLQRYNVSVNIRYSFVLSFSSIITFMFRQRRRFL